MHLSQLARNITSSTKTKAKITHEAEDVRDVRQDVSDVSERFVPQENLLVM